MVREIFIEMVGNGDIEIKQFKVPMPPCDKRQCGQNLMRLLFTDYFLLIFFVWCANTHGCRGHRFTNSIGAV
jgi:hypothetical protein